MSSKYLKIALKTLFIAVVLMVLVSIGVTVSLMMMQHTGRLRALLARSFPDVSIVYKTVHVGWHHGSPELNLDQVLILDKTVMTEPLILGHVTIDFSILSSLFHWQVVTSNLAITDVTLSAREDALGQFQLQGFKSTGTTPTKLDPKVLNWFLIQSHIELNNIALNVLFHHQHKRTLVLDQAVWMKRLAYRLRVEAHLQEMPGSEFQVLSRVDVPEDPSVFEQWAFNFKGMVRGKSFVPLFPMELGYGLSWLSGGGFVGFDGVFNHGALQRLHIEPNLQDLRLGRAGVNALVAKNLHEDILWQQVGGGGWSFDLAPIEAAGEQTPSTGHLSIHYAPNDPQYIWHVAAEKVDMNVLSTWINFGFASTTETEKLWEWVKPVGMIQGLTLDMGPMAGQAHFLGTQMQMSGNPMFPQGWPAGNYALAARWTKDTARKAWQVNLQNISVIQPNINFKIQGNVTVPLSHPQAPIVNLTASVAGQHLEAVKAYYIPATHLSPGLRHWLTAGLVALPEVTGTLVWKGSLSALPYRHNEGLFDLKLQLQGASLLPDKGWPLIEHINATMLFHNKRMTIEGNAATQGVPLEHIQFNLADIAPDQPEMITIRGQAKPTGLESLAYLASMPIVHPETQAVLKQMRVTGSIAALIKILIPVDDKADALTVTGDIQFKHNDVYFDVKKDKKPFLANVTGPAHFEDDVFSSPGLMFTAAKQAVTGVIPASPLSHLNVIIHHVALLGQNLDPLNLSLVFGEAAGFRINLSAAALEGYLVLPQGTGPVQGHFSAIHFQPQTPQNLLPPKGPTEAKVSPFLLGKLLKNLPALHLEVDHFWYGDKDLGTLGWDSAPIKRGILLEKMSLTSKSVILTAEGAVQSQRGQDHFDVNAHFSGKNYGDFISNLGYPGVISQGSGIIDFNLSWLGISPFQAQTLNGATEFNLKNGRFLKANTGFARIFGLFSLDTIINTLSFNFKKMLGGGLNFDTLQGNYTIHQGLAKTDNFILDGPSVRLSMKGQVDLVHSTVEQEVKITPQLGGSLAIAAGVIGTPIAGVAVWFADKLLSNTVLKNTGMVMQVTGPLNSPTVSVIK